MSHKARGHRKKSRQSYVKKASLVNFLKTDEFGFKKEPDNHISESG